MQQDKPVFTTEVPVTRPHTTAKANRLQTDDSIYDTLKRTKAEARKAFLQYQAQLSAHHKVKRSVETTTHKSLIKRIQFLKIYGNKKAMFHEKQLLDNGKAEREKVKRKSIDIVKRRKLENELQYILRQNEEEDHSSQLHAQARKDKQKLLAEKNLARKREIQSRHHDEVKRRNNEFNIRKKNMHTSITMRSKNNYCQKVNQELSLIQHYQNIMNDFEHMLGSSDIPSKNASTLCQTLNPTMFLTSRNTIQ